MKAKVLLLIAAFIALPAVATITVEESSSYKYLYGHGHSKDTAEIVQASKASLNGEHYAMSAEREYEASNPFSKFVRNIFTYFDPALDHHTFMNHSINPTPSVNDL